MLNRKITPLKAFKVSFIACLAQRFRHKRAPLFQLHVICKSSWKRDNMITLYHVECQWTFGQDPINFWGLYANYRRHKIYSTDKFKIPTTKRDEIAATYFYEFITAGTNLKKVIQRTTNRTLYVIIKKSLLNLT